MKPRRFSEPERQLLAKVWAVPAYTVKKMCKTFGCSTKSIRREVRDLGLTPRRIQRAGAVRARCVACEAELASYTGVRCRACYETQQPARRRYKRHAKAEYHEAPTPMQRRCPVCQGLELLAAPHQHGAAA